MPDMAICGECLACVREAVRETYPWLPELCAVCRKAWEESDEGKAIIQGAKDLQAALARRDDDLCYRAIMAAAQK